MASSSDAQRTSARAELDSLHKGMVIDLDRRTAPTSALATTANTHTSEEVDDFSEVIDVVNQTIATLQEFQIDIDRLQDVNDHQLAKIEELVNERRTLVKQNDDLSSSLVSAQRHVDELAAENARLGAAVGSLNGEREALSANLAEVTRILKAQLGSLQNKLR